MIRSFRFFSSLQLTVILLSFSMVLVFFGTLDQVQYGIWHTQRLYFESFFVFWAYPEQWPFYNSLFMVPLASSRRLPARRACCLINLVAAHFTRFKMTWKKSGIFLIHFGLILLLISELMTDLLSQEKARCLSTRAAQQLLVELPRQ